MRKITVGEPAMRIAGCEHCHARGYGENAVPIWEIGIPHNENQRTILHLCAECRLELLAALEASLKRKA